MTRTRSRRVSAADAWEQPQVASLQKPCKSNRYLKDGRASVIENAEIHEAREKKMHPVVEHLEGGTLDGADGISHDPVTSSVLITSDPTLRWKSKTTTAASAP